MSRQHGVSKRRFYLSAMLYWLRLFSAIGFLLALGFLLMTEDFFWAYLGGVCVGGFVLTTFTYWAVSSKLACPLCRSQQFKPQKCARNEKVPHFMGSYLIPLTLKILFFSERLRCVYCGTTFHFFGESRRGYPEQKMVSPSSGSGRRRRTAKVTFPAAAGSLPERKRDGKTIQRR